MTGSAAAAAAACIINSLLPQLLQLQLQPQLPQLQLLVLPTSLLLLLLLNSTPISATKSQVFWYGDQRAYLQSPSTQGFFDLIYTEECPQGIESNAIPRYAYFGPLVSSSLAKTHADCLSQCLQNRRCMAVNYFHPLSTNLEGYCELLSENQLDNPKRMRPFRHTTYYDNIRCPQDQSYDFDFYKPYESPKVLKKPERLPQKKYVKKNLKKILLRFHSDYRH